MKLIIILSAVLSFALATPIAVPDADALDSKLPGCFCKSPICPLELVAVSRPTPQRLIRILGANGLVIGMQMQEQCCTSLL